MNTDGTHSQTLFFRKRELLLSQQHMQWHPLVFRTKPGTLRQLLRKAHLISEAFQDGTSGHVHSALFGTKYKYLLPS